MEKSTPLKFNSSPLKNGGWKTTFLLGRSLFRGYVKLREGNGNLRGSTVPIPPPQENKINKHCYGTIKHYDPYEGLIFEGEAWLITQWIILVLVKGGRDYVAATG